MFDTSEQDFFSIVLAPLMDILLFMLLFFMIAYAKSTQYLLSQEIHLPSAQHISSAPEDKSKSMSIQINKDGGVIINNQAVSKENLERFLQKKQKEGKISNILIEGDQEVAYSKIVKILDQSKKAGFSKIYLLSKK